MSITCFKLQKIGEENCFFLTHLATVKNACSTFKPVLADVSKNDTLYSRARRSPSSLRTSRSGQSDLLPEFK